MEKKEENYLSAIAHHLKSPIYGIRFYLEMLASEKDDTADQDQNKYIEKALEKLNVLHFTINSLLDVLMIDKGEYKIAKNKVDLVEKTEEAIGKFFIMAKASNSEIVFNSPSFPLIVFTDSEKISKVIESLIENAIIYKSEGKGLITINIEERERDVLFSIKDNGIGIPENDISKILSGVYRSNDAIEIDPTKSGLALYIGKAAIELSGGKIWFENNGDQGGTTFYFTLLKEKK